MGWVESLHGKIVALDTTPLIYFIEEHPTYSKVVEPFFQAVEHGDITVVTSIVTLLEALVHPIKNANEELAQKYRELLFNSEGLTTITLSQEIAEEAARLRAFHNIRTPDSIQMATAIIGGASFFLTNDMRLPSLSTLSTLILDNLMEESS
jgi:predicted nucleic acid-binding protein